MAFRNPPQILHASNVRTLLGAGTTAVGAWTNIPGTPGFDFTKQYDDTVIRMFMSISAFVTTANVFALFGAQMTGPLGSIDYALTGHLYNSAAIYHSNSGVNRFPNEVTPAQIPAGNYSVIGRWSRFSGAGTMNIDGNCQAAMEFTEEWLEVTAG